MTYESQALGVKFTLFVVHFTNIPTKHPCCETRCFPHCYLGLALW